MKVSITGGSGFIGRPLVAALVARGDSVKSLSRNESVPGPGVKAVKGDLIHNKAALAEFVRDANVVVHCAGEVKNNSVMYDLHVIGTRNLLKATHDEIVRTGRSVHWIQLSSTGAYGVRVGDVAQEIVIDESCNPAPIGEYEVTKTISDELVLGLAEIEPLFTCTIIRPSIVIGSDMTNTSFFQMANMVQKRLFFFIGKKCSRSTYVHVDDVVRALLLCSVDKRAVGETFILSNDCTLDEVIQQMAEAHNIKSPRLRVPESLVRGLMKILSPFFNLPLTPERVDALTKRVGYSSVHIQQTLGFDFEYSIPEIIPAMITNRTRRTSCVHGGTNG